MAEAGSRGRSPSDSPHPRAHPSLYLVVVWGPWNWAAVAVSQELLPEAGRDETGAEGCSPGWRAEGDTPACPSSPPDQLGPLLVSPRPFLPPASRGRSPGSGSQPGGLSANCGTCGSGCVSGRGTTAPPCCSVGLSPAGAGPRSGHAACHRASAATAPSLTTNPLPCLSFASWRCNSFCPCL